MSNSDRAISFACLVVASLALWVSLRHEAEHRNDLMSETAMVLVWVTAVALLGWSVYRNVTAGNRADSRQAQLDNKTGQEIAELRREHGRLIADNTRLVGTNSNLKEQMEAKLLKCAGEVAELQTRADENYQLYSKSHQEVTRLRINVQNATVAQESAWREAREQKTLAQNASTELTKVKALNEDLRRESAELRQQINKLESDLKAKTAEWDRSGGLKKALSGLVTDAPQLLLEYKKRDLATKSDEVLVFVNEGPGTITIRSVGPLTWGGAVTREISLFNVLGPIRAGQQAESKFAVAERIGANQTIISPLPDALREIIRLIGVDVRAEMSVTFEDLNQKCFSRKFIASIDPYDGIAWDPKSIYYQSAASEGI